MYGSCFIGLNKSFICFSLDFKAFGKESQVPVRRAKLRATSDAPEGPPATTEKMKKEKTMKQNLNHHKSKKKNQKKKTPGVTFNKESIN